MIHTRRHQQDLTKATLRHEYVNSHRWTGGLRQCPACSYDAVVDSKNYYGEVDYQTLTGCRHCHYSFCE